MVSHCPRQNVGIRVIGSIITIALSTLQLRVSRLHSTDTGDGPLLVFEFDDARLLNCRVPCVYALCFCLWQILPVRIKCPPLCSRRCSSVVSPRCTDTDGEIDGFFVVRVTLYKKISIMDFVSNFSASPVPRVGANL